MSANKLPNDLIRTAFKACYHLGQLTKEMREVDAQIVSDQFGKENSADHCIDSIMFRDPAVEVLSEEAFHLYAKLCDGTLMVCCRETANFGDWLSNLKVCADISLEGRIHAGFWKKALSIPLYPLLQHLRSGKRVLFTGFSQGSAVAELVMIRLLNHIGFDIKWALQRKIIFIGFGCPLIGDDAFCKSIHSVNGPGNVPLYKDLFFHIVNKNDVVPRLTSVLSLASKSVQKLMTALLSFADATVAGKVLSEVAREAYQLLVPEYRPLGSWLFSQEHSGMTTWATYDTFDKTGMEVVIRLLTYKPEADQIKGEHFQQHRPTGYLQSLMSLEFPTERFKLRDVPCTPVFDEKVTASARWIAGYYFVQVRGSLVLYASQVKLENHPVDDITSQSKYSDIGDTLVLQVKCDKPVEKLTIVLELPYLIFGARTRTIPCECLVTQDLTDINRMPFIAILRCALFHALLAPTSAAGKTAINCLNDLDKRYNLSGSEQELNELNKDEMAVCACLVSWVMQTGTKIPDSDRIWDNPKAFLEPSSLSTTAKLLFSKLVSFNAANNDKDALNQLKMFIDKRRQPDNALSFREYFRRLDQQFQTQLNLSQLPPLISHNMLFSKFTEKSEVPNPSITAFFSAAAPIQNLIVLKMMHSPKLSMVKKNDYSFWDRVGKFFSAPLKLFNTDLYPEKSLIKADKSYGKRLIALYSMLYPQEAKNLNFFSDTFDFFKLEGDIARLSTAEIQAKLRTSFKGINEKMVGEERKICENFCHVVKNIYQLREICKNERFIAVAGMQNAGKSRLLKDLWGMKTESSLIINTREPSAYLFQFGQEIVSNIKAIDLPAITDSNVLTTAMQTMILPCTLAACIILDIKNAQDAVCLDLLSEMEKQMKFPFIVLLNQADLLLNNILEEEKPTVDEDPFAPDDSDATQKNENRKSVFDSRVNQIIFEIITQVPSLVGRIYPTCLYPSGREELKKHQYLSECDMKNDPLVQPKPENAQLVIYGKCGVRHLLDYHFRELAIKQVKPEIWGKLIVGPNLTKYNQYHASKSTQ